MIAPMRIATWNVNNVVTRLPILLAWLEVTRPDVVALQELKCTDAQFPRAALAAAGYGSLCVGQPTWNGVALLARDAEPVEIRRSLPGDPDDRQARYLEAAIGGVIVASLYVPNGNPWPGPKFDYKMAWFERLVGHAREGASPHQATRWSWRAISMWCRPIPTFTTPPPGCENALLRPEPRAWPSRDCLKQGWTDALRSLHPRRPLFTFWDYRRNRWARDAGLRIDHLLVSATLKPRLVGAGVDRGVRGVENASDHAPAWVELAGIAVGA